MVTFDEWRKMQDTDKIEDLDIWSAREGCNEAMKYAADHLHDVMMGLRYGSQSDDERVQFARAQIERLRDSISSV